MPTQPRAASRRLNSGEWPESQASQWGSNPPSARKARTSPRSPATLTRIGVHMAVTLFVGTEKGLFALEADDRRESWSPLAPMHKGWQVYSLRHDRRERTFWAGLSSRVYGAHLERSRDYGQTWEPVADSPTFPEGSERKLQQIWSLAPAAAAGGLLCGVAQAALFSSQDGGDTWELNRGLDTHPTRENWNPGAGGLCLHTIVPD